MHFIQCNALFCYRVLISVHILDKRTKSVEPLPNKGSGTRSRPRASSLPPMVDGATGKYSEAYITASQSVVPKPVSPFSSILECEDSQSGKWF